MNGILPVCLVVATGRVNAVATGTVTSFNAGQAYVGATPLMVTEAVAASDAYNGGFRYRADGALRIVNATAGLPANSIITAGIAKAPDGATCYTSAAVGADAYSNEGGAVSADGRLYVALV